MSPSQGSRRLDKPRLRLSSTGGRLNRLSSELLRTRRQGPSLMLFWSKATASSRTASATSGACTLSSRRLTSNSRSSRRQSKLRTSSLSTLTTQASTRITTTTIRTVSCPEPLFWPCFPSDLLSNSNYYHLSSSTLFLVYPVSRGKQCSKHGSQVY